MNNNEDYTHINDDVDFLLNNWKRIPVISTQIAMDKFPYIMSPWDHWNMVVDTLKEEKEKEKENASNSSNTNIHDNTFDKKRTQHKKMKL